MTDIFHLQMFSRALLGTTAIAASFWLLEIGEIGALQGLLHAGLCLLIITAMVRFLPGRASGH